MSDQYQYTNNLIKEKSPYLLQHAHNPVNWYAWSDEAFQKAKNEDKPIFLSIGYSTCHWCHVMERESFENIDVANILNENFVSIKVDREERPDVDHIYMSVCQALTGHGGWPLSIFMDYNKKPFFAGTYFPKEDKYGYPGFTSVLNKIITAWNDNRNNLMNASDQITQSVNSLGCFSSEDNIRNDIFDKAYEHYSAMFDSVYGGFGTQPKFPTPQNLYFLLRYYKHTHEKHALYMVTKTLDSMHAGGIYDHIGFGFSRYSTDNKWLVPHFEKMLYDNALLAIAYTEAYQITKDKKYSRIADEILTYALRDMTSPEGGFYSAEDADSEGVEGKFYVWSVDEIEKLLDTNDRKDFCKLYDITEKGNFEGKSIPNLIGKPDDKMNEHIRQVLFNFRDKRIHPYKDDKILTSWNGLMIAALSIASRAFDNPKYMEASENAVSFIMKNLRNSEGRLLARYRDGDSSIKAYAEDYAFLIWGLLELYETSFNPKYLSFAIDLNSDLVKYFWDNENGGIFLYGSDSEQLIFRPKEIYDGAIPSANSVAALNWLRMSKFTGNDEYENLAKKLFNTFADEINSSPISHAFALSSYTLLEFSTTEVVIVGDINSPNTHKMVEAIRANFNPNLVVILKSQNNDELTKLSPFIKDHKSIDNKTTAYVCKDFSCQAPVTSVSDLQQLI